MRLSEASKLFVGSTAVSRVYAGSAIVWEPAGTVPTPTLPVLRAAWTTPVGNAGSTATQNISLPSNTAIGDTVLVTVNSTGATAPTSTRTGTFTQVVASGTSVNMRLYRATATAAGAGTVTVTPGGTFSASLGVYAGNVTTAPTATAGGDYVAAYVNPSIAAPDYSTVLSIWSAVYTNSSWAGTIAVTTANWTQRAYGGYMAASPGTKVPLLIASRDFTTGAATGTITATPNGGAPTSGTPGWGGLTVALVNA